MVNAVFCGDSSVSIDLYKMLHIDVLLLNLTQTFSNALNRFGQMIKNFVYFLKYGYMTVCLFYVIIFLYLTTLGKQL